MNKLIGLVLLMSFLRLGLTVTTTTLPNGCKFLEKTNSTDLKDWKTTPLPFLNCTAVGSSALDFREAKIGSARTVDLSHNSLTTIDLNNLKAVENLTRLDLSSNQLLNFTSSISNNFSLATYLSLAHNKLQNVPAEALKSFPALKTLLLYSNSITRVRNTDFRYNAKLTRLYLGPNPIKTIASQWLPPQDLVNIVLRGCELDQIPPQFAEMEKLERVVLSGNNIKSIPAKSFARCGVLRNVDVGSNKIRSIESHAFTGASSLNVIDLSDNKLATLPLGAFAGINHENLQINLYENRLNCSCSLSWLKTWTNHLEAHDISTEVLYKCWNPARNHNKKSRRLTIEDFSCQDNDTAWRDCNSIPKPTQRPVKNDKELRKCPSSCYCYDEAGQLYHTVTGIKKTQYADIKLEFITNKENNPGIHCIGVWGKADGIRADVRAISVSRSKTKILDLSLFETYKQLRTLIFTGGEITTLKLSEKHTLNSLQTLKIGNNKISKIGKEILRRMPNLESLTLSHNSIGVFPDDIFDYNRKLSSLNLGSNPVKDFNGNYLRGLPVEKLNLQDLSIKAIPHVIKVLEKLTFLDLRNNKITKVEAGTISKCEKLKTLFLDNNQIDHIDTDAFNGATSLRVINLSGNKIKSLHMSVFANLGNGRLDINLWGNPIECNCKLQPFKRWLEVKEAQSPSTNIEFQCWQPLRLHEKKSFEIQASKDLKCDDDEARFGTEGSCVSSGRIALAVCLTMVLTLLAIAIAWKCKRRKRDGELRYFAKF